MERGGGITAQPSSYHAITPFGQSSMRKPYKIREEHDMATVHDVVCGMDIDPTQAAGTSEYQGQTYYFCSLGCKRQFDRDPERYVQASGEVSKSDEP